MPTNKARTFDVTMLTGWKHRIIDALHLLAIPLDAIGDDGLNTTAIVTTRRTADELEDELRAQLQFNGWMSVEELDQSLAETSGCIACSGHLIDGDECPVCHRAARSTGDWRIA